MDQFIHGLIIFGCVFAVIEMVSILYPNKIPRIPGDIYLDKFGFNIHIPFVSALVISVIVILLTNSLQLFVSSNSLINQP